MTIKVAGMWELGWSAPYTEFDLWRFPARDMGAEAWYMPPITGMSRNGVVEVESLDVAVEANPGFTPVLLDEKGETKLSEFEHPEDALYIFGKANMDPQVSAPHVTVSIETPTGAQGLLWPHQALCIVLYDRLVKSWQ